MPDTGDYLREKQFFFFFLNEHMLCFLLPAPCERNLKLCHSVPENLDLYKSINDVQYYLELLRLFITKCSCLMYSLTIKFLGRMIFSHLTQDSDLHGDWSFK